MTPLFLERPANRPLAALFIGAHSDDIEIGCGATLLRFREELRGAKVYWLVLSADGQRAAEARASAADFLATVENPTIELLEHRNGHFPAHFSAIKESFERLKDRISPDVIFTHHTKDLHQDHRVAGELTWNTFRNHLILEYEIPKFDGGLGDPNVFVPVDRALSIEKSRLLMTHFRSQSAKHWFTPELFTGFMRLRGVEGCAPGGYAEAFHCRKLTLGLRAGVA
jgi:LmbE family N-acetylglucosaminyl deacetylase